MIHDDETPTDSTIPPVPPIHLVPDTPIEHELERVTKLLRKDIRAYVTGISRHEARFLVDAYYLMQDQRMRTNEQFRAVGKAGEPNAVLNWLAGQSDVLEREVGKALDYYSADQPLGRWARSIIGVGPVIAAGLLAHIDIEKAPTVGHIWRFAGLDPTVKWKPKTKRPWNASLKRLCWIVGESFVKTSNHERAIYGRIYRARKDLEWARNFRAEFADQAREALETRTFKPDSDAPYWYKGCLTIEDALKIQAADSVLRLSMVKKLAGEPGSGVVMLPPARIHLRSTRYATKIFLAHYQHVAHEMHFKAPPPKPYILTNPSIDPRGVDHVHYIAPPNWPMEDEPDAGA